MARVAITILFTIVLLVSPIQASLIAYGICQAGCAGVIVACYSAAGVVFGTVTAGVGTPAAVLACNAAFGKCSAACAVVTLLPTP